MHSVVVLAGELLREAEKLIDEKLHPMVLIEGWRLAQSVAQKALEASAVNHANDDSLFYDDLLKIARTTLSSKLVNADKEYFGWWCGAAVRGSQTGRGGRAAHPRLGQLGLHSDSAQAWRLAA